MKKIFLSLIILASTILSLQSTLAASYTFSVSVRTISAMSDSADGEFSFVKMNETSSMVINNSEDIKYFILEYIGENEENFMYSPGRSGAAFSVMPKSSQTIRYKIRKRSLPANGQLIITDENGVSLEQDIKL